MKLNRLETHDRFKHFSKQDFSIGQCCQDLIDQRPFGNHAFYIFAHARTDDDGVTKRLIWQPRLTRPKPQTNSMLFKGYPGSDVIKIIWILPPRELWAQYEKGKMTENEMISNCIHDFENNGEKMAAPEEDDLSDSEIDMIYADIRRNILVKSGRIDLC